MPKKLKKYTVERIIRAYTTIEAANAKEALDIAAELGTAAFEDQLEDGDFVLEMEDEELGDDK